MTNLNVNEGILAAFPRLKRILAETGSSQTRILMVADGYLSFVHSAFGLSRLLEALTQSRRLGENLVITKAYRGPEASGVGADIFNFKFKKDTLNLDLYEQVWLFGFNDIETDALLDDQLKVLAEFMNKGGGVFATGDHAALGFSLCGNVPRVRSMRKWRKGDTPSRNNPDRHSTTLEGHDPGFQISDESDDVPQTIFPKIYQSGPEGHPHFLLSDGSKTINVLPDHMHEGDCVAPTKEQLEETIKYEDFPEFAEFPFAPDGKTRPTPEVIALAVSSGGPFLEDGTIRPAVIPRCFGAICVYDGDAAILDGNSVGRVVVDASFHHFVDMNLDGGGATMSRGFFDALGNPTKDYGAITRYYRNIATYLNPRKTRQVYYHNLLIYLRFMYPLIEEVRPDEEDTPENILKVGALTRRAISSYCSAAEADEMVLAILDAAGDHDALKGFISPQMAAPSGLEGLSSILNVRAFTNSILGASIIKIAKLPPHETNQFTEKLHKIASQEDGLVAHVRDGVRGVINVWTQIVEQSSKALLEFSDSSDKPKE